MIDNVIEIRIYFVDCLEGESAKDVDLGRSSVTKSLVYSSNGNEKVGEDNRQKIIRELIFLQLRRLCFVPQCFA